MTIHEVSQRYQIPLEILEEYERWRLYRASVPLSDTEEYDEQDLEHLNLIMTLYEIGFQRSEVEEYMQLSLTGNENVQRRMEMLNRHRKNALDEIHFKEKQLNHMDYLRFNLQENGNK